MLLSLGLASDAWGGDLGGRRIIKNIDNDAGTGAYTGGTPGSTFFSGSLFYPDTCGVTCTVEPFGPTATNYVFSDGSGSISGLGVTTAGIEASVEIINDEVIDQGGVDLAALFGVTLTVGQTIDVWAGDSESIGEFTPAFVTWGVSYIYATTDPFSDTSYTPTPPASPDFILWAIDEDEEDAYAATGEVVFIPEPAAPMMLAAGALALRGLAARRRSAR
jgi:hypothetical protein